MCESIEGMERMQEWLDWLERRGRVDSTIETYQKVLRRVLQSLHAAGLNTDPETIGDDEIMHLVHEDLKESSRRLNIFVLQSFVKWATGRTPGADLGILWNNEEKDRVFIDPEDFRKLMAVADECDRVILTLGAYMGLRRSEIANIKLSDIRNGELTVYGKGHGRGKRAVMRIPEIVRQAIAEYMAVRPRTSIDNLLVGWNYSTPVPISSDTVYRHLRRMGERAGVHVTPHSLRRLYATSLHEMSVDLYDIKTLMRHENINTTVQFYIRPNRVRLDRIVEELVI